MYMCNLFFFFFSSRRRHTRCGRDWSSDVCSSDLGQLLEVPVLELAELAERLALLREVHRFALERELHGCPPRRFAAHSDARVEVQPRHHDAEVRQAAVALRAVAERDEHLLRSLALAPRELARVDEQLLAADTREPLQALATERGELGLKRRLERGGAVVRIVDLEQREVGGTKSEPCHAHAPAIGRCPS